MLLASLPSLGSEVIMLILVVNYVQDGVVDCNFLELFKLMDLFVHRTLKLVFLKDESETF